MIILNEKEYAEECIKNKTVKDNPFLTLSIIAKYYYHCFNYRKKKITENLIDFLESSYIEYSCNKSNWNNAIEKIAANAGKYKLFEIDGIWITRSELNTIENIHNKTLERLAFTLLCLAKLNQLKNPNRNGWINTDAKEILKLARISGGVKSYFEKCSTLKQLSMLEFPKKCENVNCRVTYIDDNSEKVLFISDFRELGYEYLNYKGEKFIRCGECGILVRNSPNGIKRYCNECAGYTPKTMKILKCVDCGNDFEVNGNNKRTVRCPDCQATHIKEYDRLRKSI